MVLALEKIKWKHRRYLFTATAFLEGLYIFQPTNGMVSWIFEYQLDFAPFFSVHNLIGLLGLYLGIALLYNQTT